MQRPDSSAASYNLFWKREGEQGHPEAVTRAANQSGKVGLSITALQGSDFQSCGAVLVPVLPVRMSTPEWLLFLWFHSYFSTARLTH